MNSRLFVTFLALSISSGMSNARGGGTHGEEGGGGIRARRRLCLARGCGGTLRNYSAAANVKPEAVVPLLISAALFL